MELNFKQILEGWRNHKIPPKELKEQIKKVSEERLAICNKCPLYSKNVYPGTRSMYCTECGCPLKPKTKCLSCSCPLTPTKWGPVLTKVEEDKLNQK